MIFFFSLSLFFIARSLHLCHWEGRISVFLDPLAFMPSYYYQNLTLIPYRAHFIAWWKSLGPGSGTQGFNSWPCQLMTLCLLPSMVKWGFKHWLHSAVGRCNWGKELRKVFEKYETSAILLKFYSFQGALSLSPRAQHKTHHPGAPSGSLTYSYPDDPLTRQESQIWSPGILNPCPDCFPLHDRMLAVCCIFNHKHKIGLVCARLAPNILTRDPCLLDSDTASGNSPMTVSHYQPYHETFLQLTSQY